MKFSEQTSRFSEARRKLMLPHPIGEAESIRIAFDECSIALKNLNKKELDDDVLSLIEKLEIFMNINDLEDPNEIGLFKIKAEMLNQDEKFELASVIDEIAYWFEIAKYSK